MAKKKKQPTHRGPGQPRKYQLGQVVRVLLQLPADLAAAVDAKALALGMKRTAALQVAARQWTERKR